LDIALPSTSFPGICAFVADNAIEFERSQAGMRIPCTIDKKLTFITCDVEAESSLKTALGETLSDRGVSESACFH
jgi:hypothetical protein